MHGGFRDALTDEGPQEVQKEASLLARIKQHEVWAEGRAVVTQRGGVKVQTVGRRRSRLAR